MNDATKKTRTASRNKADQMISILREEIIIGKWKIGDFLPSELALCEQYELSPNTVRKGLDMLVSEGYIEKVPRIGARVVEQRSQAQISLRFGYLTDMLAYELPFHEIIAAFHEQHPTIRVIPVDLQGRPREYTQPHAEPLDVIETVALHAPELIQNGQFEPLQPTDGMYSFLNKPFTANNRLYAQAYMFAPTILCYNKDHFREMNMPEPDSSWSWDDLQQAGLRLAKGRDRYGLYFHVARELRWLPFLLQSGYTFKRNSQGKGNVRDPRLQLAMRCIYQLVNDQRLFPSFFGDNEQDEHALFVREKVSMTLTTYDRLFTYQDAPFAYDICPLPSLSHSRTLLNTIALAINSASQQKVAARLLIDYLLSHDVQKQIRQRTTRIPALRLAAERQDEEALQFRPSRFHMFREIMPTFHHHTDLNLPTSALSAIREEMKYYWSGMDDLDTVLDRLEEKLAGAEASAEQIVIV